MAGALRVHDPVEVKDLEFQLKASLRPVRPNPDFIDHLHTRLTSSPAMTVERRNTALSMLLVALSLLSGVFLLWWMHRIRSILPGR